ncbi:hypothetical protein M9H77_27968 [Catharanthus roseus]|uniref:Uncharacterized protein n=1 Tax=Catharanthus roseus TaxID=4058 RepID=A0ACC0AFN6_CATRO|nr:hypothetical protein M9H77_27968 [Catharanthus roseus]
MTLSKDESGTGRGRLSRPSETRKNVRIGTIHMSAFVSSRQQRGSPLSITVSCRLRSTSSMLWLWRWGLSPPDRGKSGDTGEEARQLKRHASAEIERVVLQSGIRSSARFCCMLCSPKMQERLARADPGCLVRKVMGEAG